MSRPPRRQHEDFSVLMARTQAKFDADAVAAAARGADLRAKIAAEIAAWPALLERAFQGEVLPQGESDLLAGHALSQLADRDRVAVARARIAIAASAPVPQRDHIERAAIAATDASLDEPAADLERLLARWRQTDREQMRASLRAVLARCPPGN